MSHASTLRLHQLRLGELDPAAASALRAHLATCDRCARRLDHQAAERAAFVAEPLPARLVPRPSWRDRLRAGWAALVLVPALAAAAALVLLREPDDGVRTKGTPSRIEAWVEVGQSARPVYSGEALGEGARVQLRYDPGDHRFVTLAGRDGNGMAEVYGTVSARGPGLVAAPFALVLDRSPGPQRFYAVMSETRPDPDAVMAALERDPVVVPGAEVLEVALPKE